MAKKKATKGGSRRSKSSRPSPTTVPLINTSEIAPDDANPRYISDEAADGLRASLKRFGDLAGIVYNRRTEELVCGHQRMAQLTAEYGVQEVEVLDAEAGLGVIRIDANHVFPVRVVDWSRAVQRAANVEANSQKVAGTFTDDLATYLIEVQGELDEEAPGLMDEVLLTELLSEAIDTSETAEPKNVDLGEKYTVVVDCEGEEQQAEVHKLLTEEGWKCRVLTT